MCERGWQSGRVVTLTVYHIQWGLRLMKHPATSCQKEHWAFLDRVTGHPRAYQGRRMEAEK